MNYRYSLTHSINYQRKYTCFCNNPATQGRCHLAPDVTLSDVTRCVQFRWGPAEVQNIAIALWGSRKWKIREWFRLNILLLLILKQILKWFLLCRVTFYDFVSRLQRRFTSLRTDVTSLCPGYDSMRRLFSFSAVKFSSVSAQIFPPALICQSVSHRAVFNSLYLSTKSTEDNMNLDLSDMRKKYKGDEEVMFMFLPDLWT